MDLCDWVELCPSIHNDGWILKIHGSEEVPASLALAHKVNFSGNFQVELLDNCVNIFPRTGNEVLYIAVEDKVLDICENQPPEFE